MYILLYKELYRLKVPILLKREMVMQYDIACVYLYHKRLLDLNVHRRWKVLVNTFEKSKSTSISPPCIFICHTSHKLSKLLVQLYFEFILFA